MTTLMPQNNQLWLASHSVGIMRAAKDMETEQPGSMSFLNFEGHDFDQNTIISPSKPSRKFWSSILNVALDDLADLVAPRVIVVCEGAPAAKVFKNSDHDARCYMIIFEDSKPDVQFISGGSSNEVKSDRCGIATAFSSVLKGCEVKRLIDRDDHSQEEIAEHTRNKVRVLSRRNLESYLYDDEVLTALCVERFKPDKVGDLLRAKQAAMSSSMSRGHPYDDLKPAAPDIYNSAKQLLSLSGVGNDSRAFERDVLAKLVSPALTTYKELEQSIFALRLQERINLRQGCPLPPAAP